MSSRARRSWDIAECTRLVNFPSLHIQAFGEEIFDHLLRILPTPPKENEV